MEAQPRAAYGGPMESTRHKTQLLGQALALTLFAGCPGSLLSTGAPDGGAAGGDADCTTAQCDAGLTCLATGCGLGERCDSVTHACVAVEAGPRRLYRAETLAGHAFDSPFATRDAVGRGAFGEFHLLVAAPNGRHLYVVDQAVVLRVEVATARVETLSGLGWPGEANGPPDVAQFETNFYQNGGLALTADAGMFVFTSPTAIRAVNVVTGEATTVPRPFGRNLRSLAIGRETGNLYVTDWAPSAMDVVFPDGGLEARPLFFPDGGGPIGYVVVDESRWLAYGLDRNRQSGALYRWSLDGGPIEWLNHDATGTRDPVQYLSDGPVARLDMANPAGLSIDREGFVYIGAGDGQTFRRYDPDREVVQSLCRVPSDAGEELFEWCFGDGVRNRPFGTWPSNLAFDDSGNGFFGYSVWPRLVMLRRLQ